MKIIIFEWFWRKRLKDSYGDKYKIVKVKGWRTCLLDHSCGNRSTITFLFKIGKYII